MSALPQDPGPVPDPSQPFGDASADANVADAGDAYVPFTQDVDIGSLIRAALVDGGEAGPIGLDGDAATAGPGAGEHVYDGHVPFALDSDFLPAIDATLDLLTTSADLFDVPAADFGLSVGDTGDA